MPQSIRHECHRPSFPFAPRSLLGACFDTDWIFYQVPCQSVSPAILSPLSDRVESSELTQPSMPFVILQPSFEMQRSSLHIDLALWTQNVHDFVQRKKKSINRGHPQWSSSCQWDGIKKKREHWKKKKKSETMHRTRVVCFWIGAVGFPLFNPRETKHCVIYSIWHVDSVGLPYWAFTVAHDTFRGCCRPRYQNMRLEMMTWSCSDRWGSANLTCESW